MFLIFWADDKSLCYANAAARSFFAGLIKQPFKIGDLHTTFDQTNFFTELDSLNNDQHIAKKVSLQGHQGVMPMHLTFCHGQISSRKVIEVSAKSIHEVDTDVQKKKLPGDPGPFWVEKALLDISEKTMATIIELAVDGIVIINELGIIQGFNQSAERMFGYKALDVIGKNVSVLTPEPHRTNHDAYIKRYLTTGIPHIVGIGREVDALHKDGSLFPIDLAVGEVKSPAGSIFTGFIRDISENRKIESERNSFFQMSLDLFCILDLDGTIKRSNSQWLDLLGYAPEEVNGKSLMDFIQPADHEGSPRSFLAKILGSHNVLGQILQFRQQNGKFRWILWNSTVDKANQAIYGVGRDITEQKRILEELESAKSEAEKSSEAKSFFIAKMSHELRTPLNSIIGFSRHLQKKFANNFNEKEVLYLDRISSNGNSLLRLINNLLDFSKTESGFSERDLQSINLPELLSEVFDFMHILIEEKSIDIDLKLPADCKPLRSDPIKLRQIVQNLIDNAIKYSDGKPVRVELFVDANSNPLKIDVIDSGRGIAESQLQPIFEAFNQGDNSVARKFGGAGLGLAIARSFADILNIQIAVKSTLGKGSCFSIIFPQETKESL